MDRVSAVLHGTVILIDNALSVFQLYEQGFFVVLSAEHCLLAPLLHHCVDGFAVFLGFVEAMNKVVHYVFDGTNEGPGDWILPSQICLAFFQLQVYGIHLGADERKFHLKNCLLYLVVPLY